MAVGWDDHPEVAAWRGLPALDGDAVADACVIGLGGSGLAAVDELVGRGLSVVGVDAGRIAAGAAGRNGGFLLGGGEPALHEAIAAWGRDAAAWLYAATLAELDRLEAQLGDDVVRRVGSIRLAGLPGPAESDAEAADLEKEIADCRQQIASLRDLGIRVDEYDGELGTGLFLPDDAATNPALRAVQLATLLRDRARLLENTRVVDVRAGSVRTEHGTITARIVIVAVDGRLELVLPQLADRVRTARLQMLATTPVAPNRLPCPVYGRWGYDYAQQTPDGRVFVGGGRDKHAEAEWTTEAEPTEGVQSWIEHVARRMAGDAVEVTHRWAASVGYTADGRALCTEVDDGVMACGGYSGTGNLVGPVATRAAVAHLLDGTAVPAAFSS